jgi:hypothetical protein
MASNLDNITKYLWDNKGKYSEDELLNELSKIGYAEDEIRQGIRIVYGSESTLGKSELPSQSTGFFNMLDKKVYSNKKEKFFDFLFGFLGVIIVNSVLLYGIVFLLSLTHSSGRGFDILNLFNLPYLNLLGIVLYIFEIWYFAHLKRKYVVIGIISQIAIPIIFIGACFVIFAMSDF